MINFKCCPKCSGDVLLERDSYGWYEQCIQCGYLRDLQSMVDIEKSSTKVSKNDAVLSVRL